MRQDCVHLTFSSSGRRVLFPNEALRRRAVRTVWRVARGHLALFSIVDDHGHVVAVGGARELRQLRRRLLLALRPVATVSVEPPHVTPVESRSHLERLVKYLLGQVGRHEIDASPALWSGSCFQDLVGARVLPGAGLRIAEQLPRLRMRDVYAAVGMPAHAIEPLGDEEARAAGASRIVSASASALAVGPALAGVASDVFLAKRAVVELARTAGIADAEVTWALGVSARTLRRMRTRPVDTRLLRAVRTRLALEDAVARGVRTAPAA